MPFNDGAIAGVVAALVDRIDQLVSTEPGSSARCAT